MLTRPDNEKGRPNVGAAIIRLKSKEFQPCWTSASICLRDLRARSVADFS